MFYLLSFLFLLYTSIPSKTQIEAVFEPYIRVASTSFSSILSDSHLVMKLGKIKDKEVVGFCAKEYDIFKNITRRIIIIDKTYWDRLDYKVRQLLIWHELGHCLFNKKHDNLLMHDGCPNSIMHPTILSDRCVELHYETYLQQIL